MDISVLQVVLISVLSPVLLLIGVLYLIFTPHLGASAIAFNLLTVCFGGLRLVVDASAKYSHALTFFCLYFLVLALVANVRCGRRIWAAKARKPVQRRVEIESATAWVVYKGPDEKVAFALPRIYLENRPELAGSDLKLTVTCDPDIEPISGVFSLNDRLHISLPENLLGILQKAQMIRFEITE